MAHRRSYLSLALLNFTRPGDRVQSTRGPFPHRMKCPLLKNKMLKASGVLFVDLRISIIGEFPIPSVWKARGIFGPHGFEEKSSKAWIGSAWQPESKVWPLQPTGSHTWYSAKNRVSRGSHYSNLYYKLKLDPSLQRIWIEKCQKSDAKHRHGKGYSNPLWYIYIYFHCTIYINIHIIYTVLYCIDMYICIHSTKRDRGVFYGPSLQMQSSLCQDVAWSAAKPGTCFAQTWSTPKIKHGYQTLQNMSIIMGVFMLHLKSN